MSEGGADGPPARAARAAFSSTDAVWAAPSRARAQPGPFLGLAIVYVAAGFVLFLPAMLAGARDLGEGMWPWDPGAGVRPVGAFANLAGLLMWPVGAAIEAALLRWMLSTRGAGVRFGVDELKILLIHVLYLLAAFAAALPLLIPAMLVLALAQGAWALLGVVLLGLAAWASIHVLLRFSAAPALTLRDGGLRFFESWRATRGYTLALLGAHVLRLALVLAGFMALAVLLAVVGLAVLAPVLSWLTAALFGGAPVFPAPPYALGASGGLFVAGFAAFLVLDFLRLALRTGVAADFVLRTCPPPAPGLIPHRAEAQPENGEPDV